MKVGQHVRIVSMDGCMADTRNNIRDGTIIGFVDRKIYGSGDQVFQLAKIKLDRGDVVEYVTEPRLWTEYEGVMEYHE